MENQIRQNYHENCEANVNKQINMELYASYVYLAMATHFEQDDRALPGHAKFYHKASNEERDHAKLLMKYQNDRGGRLMLQDVKAPAKTTWKSLESLENALALERKVNESLLALHKCADEHGDAHLCDFLEGNFLNEQVEAINS